MASPSPTSCTNPRQKLRTDILSEHQCACSTNVIAGKSSGSVPFQQTGRLTLRPSPRLPSVGWAVPQPPACRLHPPPHGSPPHSSETSLECLSRSPTPTWESPELVGRLPLMGGVDNAPLCCPPSPQRDGSPPCLPATPHRVCHAGHQRWHCHGYFGAWLTAPARL